MVVIQGISISKPIPKSKGALMNREPWVAYLVVLVVVAAMMYGKYLMGGGGEEHPNTDTKDKEEK